MFLELSPWSEREGVREREREREREIEREKERERDGISENGMR